ncbi:MAG: site-specific integrase [Cohaesibacter sp.]|nr:site-specific integrase [Cohaesibacter sp.]
MAVSEMRLYDENNNRLYINSEERERFIKAAEKADRHVRTLCLTLLYTGCRISEALELTAASVQLDARLISVRSLKKRSKHVIREVPIPPALVDALELVHGVRAVQRNAVRAQEAYLWSHRSKPLYRSTGYRWIKEVMAEAGIEGAQATAKGLRHGYGIQAIRKGIQLHMLQKWMGHASMTTTAIYANAIGKEELDLADQMW